MEKISNDIINTIREKTDIVEVISSYIPLTQRGKNAFGVCPFHDDTHPSMSVNKEKQIYKCFSCGAAGNVFKFISDYENISFIEAVKMLGDRTGISITLTSEKKREFHDEELYQIYELAGKFYQNNMSTKDGREAREYLKNRKMDDSVIKEFGIGLSLTDNKVLAKLLTGKNYTHKNLEKSALLVKYGYEYSDLFYHRIMFPLWDLQGRVVGFSGRIYSGEDPSKYINTRETEIFKKGELVYNYHRAKMDARKVGSVIVMEGFMDVIRAYTIGIHNVVATMGTAVTKVQAGLLKRMAKDVILCFDGDAAGAKATASCIEELAKIGVTPKVVRLENNMDPDEYIKEKGKEAFLAKLENPIHTMDFKLTYLKNGKDLTSAEDTAHYASQIVDELSKIEDDMLREITLKKLSSEVDLDIDFLRNQLENKKQIETTKVIKVPVRSKPKRQTKYEKAEQNILYYMLASKEVVKWYIKEKPFLPNSECRMLAMEITHFYKENGKVELADIMTEVSDRESLLTLINKTIMLPLKEEYSKDEIYDYFGVIREYNIDYEIARLKKQMAGETLSAEKAKIASQIVALKVEESCYVKRN